jgi:hypothetical protein
MKLEFYPTPRTFTRFLFSTMCGIRPAISGVVCEPTVGNGAILEAVQDFAAIRWVTNDIDSHWSADYHLDAAKPEFWETIGEVDWVISNTPWSLTFEIATLAIKHSRVGVALHTRASAHEVLKTGMRRTWMTEHTPTGTIWLPRFAYQRSITTGDWATDNVCGCWIVWLRNEPQFIRYATEDVLRELDTETPSYRRRLDALMASYPHAVGGIRS